MRPSSITMASQRDLTTTIMTAILCNSPAYNIAIIETPSNRVEFKVGDCVNLLHIHNDVIIAIAKIISIH